MMTNRRSCLRQVLIGYGSRRARCRNREAPDNRPRPTALRGRDRLPAKIADSSRLTTWRSPPRTAVGFGFKVSVPARTRRLRQAALRLSGGVSVFLAAGSFRSVEALARVCAANIAGVARLLYSQAMRSATFPPIRVEPEVRAEVEAVLREGETLTQFIEEAVVAAAAWRRVQSEFVTRGEAAIERWKREGGGHGVDEVMADLQARLDDAKRRAAQRAGR